MKLILMGAHRTGKTTLAKALAEKIGITYLDANIRELIEGSGILVNDHLSSEKGSKDAIKLQKFIAKVMKEFLELSDDYVCDRSLCDVAAYTHKFDSDEAMRICKESRIENSVSILIQPGIPWVDADAKGSRETQAEIADLIMYYGKLSGANPIIVPKDCIALEDRLEYISSNLCKRL